MRASGPNPGSGAVHVPQTSTLTWSAGEKAARAKRKAKQAGGATTNEVEAHAARVADRRDGKPASTEDTAVEDKGAGAAGEGQRPGTWKSGFGGEVAAGETRDVTHSAEKRGGIVA